MAIEYIWMLNPDNRKVEVEKERVSELLQRGFKHLTKSETPKDKEDEDEFLDVIEI